MGHENQLDSRFAQRRRMLLGTAAALCPWCGTLSHAADPGKPLPVGGLPVT